MTPEERAEKLTLCWQPQGPQSCGCPMCLLRPQIAAEIRAAVDEAITNEKAESFPNVIEVGESVWFMRGQQVAYLDAAGIIGKFKLELMQDGVSDETVGAVVAAEFFIRAKAEGLK